MSKVVIIGSGLGGLSCGYILQRNGFDVTVLEQGTQIGGCLQCFNRSGVRFETGMHFIGSADEGQTMNRVMNYFGMHDVRLSRLDTNAYDTVYLQGNRFCFANGREQFIDHMANYFPREKDALTEYVKIIGRIASASTLNSLTSEERDMAANTEYQTRTINAVLDELFKDELLKNVLVGNLPLYAAEYDKTPFSQHAFIMDFYNQSSFRIVGGSDSIAHSLKHNIEEMGGMILARHKVAKIVCNDTKAVGVVTDDEQFFGADYIISTIHPNRLMEILDTGLIRPAFRKRICGIPNTSAGFAVYLKFKENAVPYMNTNFYGYSSPTPWGCENYLPITSTSSVNIWPKGYLYMHMCHKDNAQWAKSGVVLSYMNYRDVEKWAGTKIERRGDDYEEFKRKHAEKLMQSVEHDIPGFLSGVERYYTSTPLTYVDYTGTEKGAMYGVAKDVNLGVAGRVPYRTKIPNLLLAGQNVNSHGMMGVIVGTIVTCSELIPAETIHNQINEANKQ